MTAAQAGLRTRLMVGMEIHVELATRSKMFTGAPNTAHPDYFDAPPNSLCDPVVLGMPGVLPVINKQAVEMAMLVGLALGCTIARFTKWDRKSYYYPDLPKNYQISQYDLPLCSEGTLAVPEREDSGAPLKTIRILRAHLEEDAGKLLHEAPGGGAIDGSIVDLNRAGTPLLEIVTYPDFDTPEQVVSFAQALRDICRCLGVTEGIMQKGHMRFEPNINVIIEKDGQTYKTPIVEIKNLNSFKALHGSVTHEYERQVEEWLETGKVMGAGAKSTRGWDDARQATFLQREKEDAHDYRYFPDPDLVPVVVSDGWLESVRRGLPELPLAREQRYIKEKGLSPIDARAIAEERDLWSFFEGVLDAVSNTQRMTMDNTKKIDYILYKADPQRSASTIRNNLMKLANERGCKINDLGITPWQVCNIDGLRNYNFISSSAADDLYRLCCENPDSNPEELAKANGLLQVSDDGALSQWIDQALAANPKAVEAIKGGKDAAIGSLVGAVMKLSKGQANPKAVGEMIRRKLQG